MKFLQKTVWIAALGLLVLAGAGRADKRNLNYPHNSTNSINCWSCHYTTASVPTWVTDPVTDIDDTPWNRLCWSCHNETDAIYVDNHSSLATNSLNYTWPTATTDMYGTASSSVECRTCHFVHHQLQERTFNSTTWQYEFNSAGALFTGAVSGISASTVTVAGAGWTENQWAGYMVVPNVSNAFAPATSGQYHSYDYKIVSNTSDTLTVEGPVDLTVLGAGSTMAIYYGRLVRSTITTPSSGAKTVKFYDTTGTHSFADGDATRDGVCEVCHTLVTHFRNNGTGSQQLHENLDGKAGTKCVECHVHTAGFGHGGGKPCVNCHGHDTGTHFDPDMTSPYTAGATASEGTGSSHSHSTHTETDSDDAKGPGIYCADCHDITKIPYFKSGTDANGDGNFNLAETNVCDTCHSKNGTYNGVDDPTVGAKANWETGIYEADGVTLRAGKEKWCATCHDENPSQIQAVAAPNVVGDEDGATLYGPGWGFYKTGHGLPKTTTYPASGGLTAGAGKECLDCHDPSLGHIDGLARSFDCSDGCDSDEYRQGYRLKLIDSQNPMTLPLVQAAVPPVAENYRLCFSNNGCHLPEKYLLTGNDYGTSFRDDIGESPDATRGLTPPINAHEYHLNATNFGIQFSADWRDPPDTYKNSNITCISCHNVHGSSQLAMIRTGDLIDKGDGMDMWYHKNSASDPSATTLADSEGTYWNATSSANLCHVCHGGNLIYHRTPPAPQSAPTLAWTGEANYTVDGVEPESAVSGTSFYFRVKYTDVNYDLPEVIQIWVDEDDSGTYEADEKYDLLEVDAGDRNCADGKLYKKILPVTYAGDGVLNYKFYASDRNAAATGDPTLAGKFITLSKVAPVLDWTGEDGYSSDGVSPNTAVGGSNFTFRVKYTDSANQPPSSIQLWLDRNDVSGYEASEKINLTAVDPGDTDYTDGKLYTTTTAIAYAGDGVLNYRFYALDAESTPATGTPTTDRTVTVNASNSAPQLSWIYAENYVRDGVDPDTGISGDTFIFQVKYIDVDNNAPTAMQLWVDLNDDDDYEDGGEKIDMLPVDGDADYSDGKLYVKSVVIAAAGDGLINYRFYASDGSLAATGTPTYDSLVTIIMDAVTVTCPGQSLQTAINNASNGDTILLANGTCTETIVIDNKDLTIRAINKGSAFISGGGTAGPVVKMQNGADSVLDGVTIQNGVVPWAVYGGGVSISESSPTIANCLIDNNTSGYGGGGIYFVTTTGSVLTVVGSTISNNDVLNSRPGGGILMEHGGAVVMSGSTVSGNTAVDGGGFYINDATASSTSSLTVSGSTFSGNIVTSKGGAIYAASNNATSTVNLIIADTDFIDNESVASGGALYLMNNDSVGATMTAEISDSTFSLNTSTGGSATGGALFSQSLNSATISGCTFSENSAISGGGINVYNGSVGNVLTVTDTVIKQNSASNGGGLYLGGDGVSTWSPTFDRCEILGNTTTNNGAGVYAVNLVPVVFKNCIIAGNKSTGLSGGGFYLNNSLVNATITNCTITGNYAADTDSVGGGICAVSSAVATLKNTIMWGNKAYDPTNTDEVSGVATVTASYSDIGQTGYEGNNNVNVDPMFVSPVSYTLAPSVGGNYHLQVDSQVVDAGTGTGAPPDDIDGEFRPSGAGYDMGADEVITEINSAPTLSWTGEANFSSDGVNPDIGADGASFEFRINYVDADNNPPSAIQVWVDKNDDGDYLDGGEKVDLVAVDGGDTTYSDGKLYHTDPAIVLNYSDNNGLIYRFYAADGTAVATGAPVANNTVLVNDAPTLSWLADAGYDSTDGVNPDSGLSTSNFVFKIKYTDANNNPPNAIQVWIDKNDDGDFADPGEMISMAEVDPNDTNYADGKDYTKTVAVSKVGVVASTVLEYRFYASDGSEAVDGAPTGDPTSATANTVTVNNNVPVLAWTGEVNFSADGVNPDSAVFDSSFEFRVKYTDADNEAPSSIQVWVDKNNDLSYVEGDGEYIDLVEVDAGDTNYADGKLYHTSPDITLSTTGNIKYRFYATDSVNDATGTPTSDATVAVTSANDPPVLDWTGEANYTTDGVDPDSDFGGLTFTFRVKYTDSDNDAPNVVQVWVDKNDINGYEAGEKFDMTAVDPGDTTYSDGKLYTADVAVPYVADGTVSYRFFAKDTLLAEATGNAPVSGSNTVTVLNAITVCSSGCDYTTIQAAINAAADGNSILVDEGTYSENITFPTDARGITIKATGTAAATIINGTTTDLPVVTFNNTNAGITAVLDGFTISNQKELGNLSRGVSITKSSKPTIQNCVITLNKTATAVMGGGVYILGNAGTTSAGATINNCSIVSNTTGKGAVYCSLGILSINNSNIDNNVCTFDGGGIRLEGSDATKATITGGSIDGNAATTGSGIYIGGGADLDYTGGSISGNINTGTYGGGINVLAGSSVLNLTKMYIKGNYATQRGGGLYQATGVTTTLKNCNVTGNSTALGTWQPGGGISNYSGTVNIDSCTIAGNYGGLGGGLYNDGNISSIVNATNSIFWGNTAGNPVISQQIYNKAGGQMSVTESDVQGGWGTAPDNNINSDPLFINGQAAGAGSPTILGDFHLNTGSPCINVGATDLTEDIDGGARPVSVDDMGSDEYGSP
ncbi:MAG: hypothetical protein OEV73_03555 [Desulfobulbaceae bacterium]|nr:hypothetical protein [Desulfobulbaceae bacterium]